MAAKPKNVGRKAVNFKVPKELADAINKRRGGEPFAAQVINDLFAYNAIVHTGLKTAQRKLTKGMAKLILDTLEGTWVDPATLWLWLSNNALHTQIEDIIRLHKLDEKWGVDRTEILRIVAGMSEIEIAAILDWAKSFWQNNAEIDDAVKHFLEG